MRLPHSKAVDVKAAAALESSEVLWNVDFASFGSIMSEERAGHYYLKLDLVLDKDYFVSSRGIQVIISIFGKRQVLCPPVPTGSCLSKRAIYPQVTSLHHLLQRINQLNFFGDEDGM
ncbi:Protein Cc2D2B [Manis pentadactyla]|nr:Protein Cc2D2B [Manis pentadactyla]